MADDSIQKYLEARAAHDAIVKKVQGMADNIKAIAGALDNWDNLMFSNISIGFPAEIAMGSVPTIDAKRWPSVEPLAQAIADYHQARHAMDNAWRQVPQEMRSGLQEPPPRPSARTRRGWGIA